MYRSEDENHLIRQKFIEQLEQAIACYDQLTEHLSGNSIGFLEVCVEHLHTHLLYTLVRGLNLLHRTDQIEAPASETERQRFRCC